MAEYLREELSDIDVHSGVTSKELERTSDLTVNLAGPREFFTPSWRRTAPLDLFGILAMVMKKKDKDVTERTKDEEPKFFKEKDAYKETHKRIPRMGGVEGWGNHAEYR